MGDHSWFVWNHRAGGRGHASLVAGAWSARRWQTPPMLSKFAYKRTQPGTRPLLVRLEPSCGRKGAVIAVGELTTYDVVKSEMKRRRVFGTESPLLHVTASLITGVVATTVAAPFDIIKTRCMADEAGLKLYKGAFDCAKQLVQKEGAMALYKGWWPSYFRLGPHALIQFPILEQLRFAV